MPLCLPVLNGSEINSVGTTPLSSPSLSRSSSFTALTSSSDNNRAKDLVKPAINSALHSSTAETVRSICCVGAGYVGGPTAAVIAFANPHIRVTVIDKDAKRIRAWQSKHLPIHEPGLSDIVRIARDGANAITISQGSSRDDIRLPDRAPNLFFSTDCDKEISEADMIFLSVNTPTKNMGIGAGAATDISMLESATRSIALAAKPGAIIVEKSTVPCRTARVIRDILEMYRPGVPFEILSNPEFLAEGTAVNDLINPARVLIGSSQTPSGLTAAASLVNIYATWVPLSNIITVHLWSSELSKLVANAMLAQRISSINTISAICEKTGADVKDISKAVGLDSRLGSKFLRAGLGFGGSCFKKDILSLSYLADSLDLPEVADYWRSVVNINIWQCARFVERVIKNLNGSLRGKKLTLLGYAFKKDTSDTRESQTIDVVRQLLAENPAEIAIFDPRCNRHDVKKELTSFFSNVTPNIFKPLGPIEVYDDPYAACGQSTAVLILTEWDQFHYPSMPQKHSVLESNALSTKNVRPPMKRGTSQMDVLEMRASIQDDLSRLQNIHIRPDPQNDIHGRFRPEPDCAEDCRDCMRGYQAQLLANENLQWEKVVDLMQQPRWVFDGRGVVDQNAMEKLGFRVESIGRASARSRLHGFDE